MQADGLHTTAPERQNKAPAHEAAVAAAGLHSAHLDVVSKHQDAREVAHLGTLCLGLDGGQVLEQLGWLLVLRAHLHHLRGAGVGKGKARMLC